MRTANSDWEHICLQAELVVCTFERRFNAQIVDGYRDDIEVATRTCWKVDADGRPIDRAGRRAHEGGGWAVFAPEPTTVEAWRDLTKALANLSSLLGAGR